MKLMDQVIQLSDSSSARAEADADAYKRALSFVRAQGMPTRQHEDWKYTSLKVLNETAFIPAAAENVSLEEANLKKVQAQFLNNAINLVFVNGMLNTHLSQELPVGAAWIDTVSKLDPVQTNAVPSSLAPGIVSLAQPSRAYADSLEAMNYVFALKTYSMRIQKETSLKQPIHFIFWSQGKSLMSSLVLQLRVESRAQVQFMESHVGGDETYFANSYVDLQIGDSAKVSLIKVQEQSLSAVHIGRTRVQMQSAAQFENLQFSTGALLARHSLEVLLQGSGANAQVHGLYAVTGSQHVDNDTTIDHIVGHCDTSQLYKGLLDDESRAVFNGKVLIRKDSQKANSEQLNNNLLLSRQAEVDSKPMLQIEADDVKASHGSTVGQMNQEELFYLLSRGIPKDKAISMMSYGFLAEVIDRLENEFTKDWLKQKLDRAFAKLSTVKL